MTPTFVRRLYTFWIVDYASGGPTHASHSFPAVGARRLTSRYLEEDGYEVSPLGVDVAEYPTTSGRRDEGHNSCVD